MAFSQNARSAQHSASRTTQKCASCVQSVLSYILRIGFDDTDSPHGMCTTFLAYKMVSKLKRMGAEFLDFPWLVRFNPNIPWKTRGNGAVSLAVRTNNADRVESSLTKMLEQYSDTEHGANPGIVFLQGSVPEELHSLADLALWRLVRRSDIRKILERCSIAHSFFGNGQGLVGAAGAIGYSFADHTMELLGYRAKRMFGKKRNVSSASVRAMQEAHPQTFNSYDSQSGRVMIAPAGPDPVLYGIRGENPQSLLSASAMLQAGESPVGYLMFRSNQGTGDHLRHTLNPSDLRAYDSGTVSGVITSCPVMGRGGDIFFILYVQNHSIHCAVYKETGLTGTARHLAAGDIVKIGGGIRRASLLHPRTLNVEFLRIIKLARHIRTVNPMCPRCSKRMKSKGKSQGYRCAICGKRAEHKTAEQVPRSIKSKLYIPIPGAHRHLTRPQKRLGTLNHVSFDAQMPWFYERNADVLKNAARH